MDNIEKPQEIVGNVKMEVRIPAFDDPKMKQLLEILKKELEDREKLNGSST